MLHELTLRVPEGKRLIAKGIVRWPPLVERLESGVVVIAKGTTNRYVAEEILGQDLSRYPYAWGVVAPPGKIPLGEDLKEIVIVDGKWEGMRFEEAVASMSPGDIFIKGGNALNYENKVVGVLSTSPTGGTIGTAFAKVLGSRVRLLIPIGLEKCVSTPIERICSLLDSPEGADEDLPTMFPLSGHVFTEIEALEALFGLESFHISSGGVLGCEGSVRLLVRGSPDAVSGVLSLEESLRQEPDYGW